MRVLVTGVKGQLGFDVVKELEKRIMRYSDTDINGHVNNTKYMDWCCKCRDVHFNRNRQEPPCIRKRNEGLLQVILVPLI